MDAADTENNALNEEQSFLTSGLKKVNDSFKNPQVIKLVSYSIDICILICCIVKYTMSSIGAREVYNDNSLPSSIRDAYFTATII